MRSSILVSLCAAFFFIAVHSHAITLTDTNANGMSDYWEKHWNGGALFPAGFSPTADPDGDGWNNLTEAVAGTNPKDARPPAGLVQTKITQSPAAVGYPDDAPKAFVVSWPTVVGKQYKLLVSPDLSAGSWVLFDQPMMGTGAEIQIAIEPLNEDGSQPERLFWRVAADDTDTDGDTINDYEEAAKGTNPLAADTDGDGIADNIDPTPTVSNAVANPDGAGLVDAQNAPLSISTGIAGRWDFENTTSYVPPTGSGQMPFYYPDSTGNGRKAAIYSPYTTNAEGMVSKAYDNESGSFLSFPNDLIGNNKVYSVSFWAMIKQGTIASTTVGNPVGLFSHHYRLAYSQTVNGVQTYYWGRYQEQLNGLWIEKNSQNQEVIRAGTHTFRNYSTQSANYGAVLTTPVVADYGISIVKPLGSSDDGKWHHYTFIVNQAQTLLYIDGVEVGKETDTVAAIPNNEFSSISLGRVGGRSPTANYGTGNAFSITPTRARFDRLRVYTRKISPTEAAMLHHEDIDHDGLWDITENATRLWRDTNSNGIQNPGENEYMVSPFIAQPTEGDADDDGLVNLIEQTIGTEIANPDTDGDLMPDGWEYQFSSMAGSSSVMMAAAMMDTESSSAAATPVPYLDPKLADGALDPDGDGVSNADEFRNNSDPRKKDSDNDGKNDNIEIGQGSSPSDASDGGNPTPAAQQLSILLGIGDKSGSKSEDYVLNCYRIDPATRQEQRVYTLRAGGFGQYKEETKNLFKKGETYTFQIDWQSTNMNVRPASSGVPLESPDFDYSFKVQPQGDHGTLVVDSYDPASHTSDTTKKILNDEANDVATTEKEFKETYEDRRVVVLSPDLVPEQIAYNGNFDEGNTGAVAYGTTGANTDAKTLSLKASRASVDGRIAKNKIVTDDLYKGWFGFNPAKVPEGCLDTATITVGKVAMTDPDTGENSTAQIRLHATWDGTREKNVEPYSIVQDILGGNAVPINLTSQFYTKSASIPPHASFWVEGAARGPIKLEFKCTLGSQSYTWQKTLPIRCQWTKQNGATRHVMKSTWTATPTAAAQA